MSIFQVVAVLFALFMIYVIRLKSKKYHLKKLEIALWYLVWIGFIILAIFPDLLLGVVHTLNFSRVFDLLVVIAFMVISGLLVFLYFDIKDLRLKLEKYVRQEAIKHE